MGEADTVALSTLTSVTVLSIGDVVRVGARVGPFSPAGGVDHIGHRSLLEDDAGVLGPGTACSNMLDLESRLTGKRRREKERTQVVSSGLDRVAVGSLNGRLVDHIVGLVGLGSATVGGDVSSRGTLEDSNVTLVKPGASALAEDEVTGRNALASRCQMIGMEFNLHSTLNKRLSVDLVSGLSEESV